MTEMETTYTTAYAGPTLMAQQEIEKLFAAAAFINPEYALDTCGWLKPGELSDIGLRRYWENLTGKHRGDGSAAALEAGVYTKILGVMTLVSSSLDVVSYAREIQRRAYLVSTDKYLGELMHARQANDTDRMRKLVSDLYNSAPATDEIIPNALDCALAFIDYLDNLGNCINTGIAPLDEALGGLEPGTLTLLASRPSMGKSTLAFQISRQLAEQLGKKVLYFSNEMTKESLWKKAACGALEIDWRDVKNGKTTPEQNDSLRKKAIDLAVLSEDRLHVDDRHHHTTESIWPIAARQHPDLIVVDVIFNLKDKEERRQDKLAVIATNLRDMAYQVKCPVLGLHHIGRAAEGQAENRPTMSNLADSGDLEKIADVVLLLHSPDYYEVGSNKRSPYTDIIVGKNREGTRNGVVHLAFNTRQQWFVPAKEAQQ